MILNSLSLNIENILLDPNNYRFHDIKGWRKVNEKRYHEQKIQETAFNFLKNTPIVDLSSLKDSIRTNGFVPLEIIVVKKYNYLENKYVVVEGNRRIAAIKWLIEDESSGNLTLSTEDKNALTDLNVLFLDEQEPENAHAMEVLMAIRHVSGVKEWGAYQQARLIVELMERPSMSFATVAERLGMSAREVGRRFRASKALQQMENDDEYKELAETSMYAIFHEVVAQPNVRDWLGWNEGEYRFENKQNLSDFYSLMCDSEERKAKITSYEHVRTKLKAIIPHSRAITILLDPDKTLEEAYQVALEETGPSASVAESLENYLKRAIIEIDNLPTSILRNLSGGIKELLIDLKRKIERTLVDYEILREHIEN